MSVSLPAPGDESIEPADRFAASDAPSVRALAGPGTGKTYALMKRLRRLLEDGADPSRILVVTFARAAARDLVAAVAEVEAAGDDLVPRTLHSYCFSLLGRERVLQATGRTPRILLEFERDVLLMDLIPDFGGKRERRKLLRAFEASWARRQVEEPGAPVPGLDQAFQEALMRSLQWHAAMLVGEVVPIALSYLSNNPHAPERTAYRHVLVDEYQDLNRAEQGVIDAVAEEAHLTVIGDDDQSIYGFKWANPEGIRDFHLHHPGTEDVYFAECRRCPQRVVEMAQSVIERNPDRLDRRLLARPENGPGEIHNVQWGSLGEEANGIAAFVQEQVARGVPRGGILVLANSREIGYCIRDSVRLAGVECTSFFREEAVDSDEAKAALTLLTLLANEDDRVALRMWLALGATTERRPAYRRLQSEAWARGGSVSDVLRLLEAGDISIPHSSNAVTRWLDLQDVLAGLRALGAEDLGALVDHLLPADREGLAPLRETALAALDEANNVQGLVSALRYGVSQRETPLEAEEVRVMSMHASKGLTARVVVLAGLVQGLIPRMEANLSSEEQAAYLAEQRRLFYVALTRTTETLVLSSYATLDLATAHRLRVAQGPRQYGAVRTFASQFLDELGSELPGAIRGSTWIENGFAP